ncbi:MAG: 2OG-Fe(II) oxygenase [Bryobacterales bacterium]|nr:2OG-Fe(II) oxygenase [Bryobacterales bacterium]
MGVTSVRYNVSQKRLEELLSSVDRPGDYCFHGRSAEPMPRMRVDGVGAISFPVPESQAQALVGVAEQAPYGRGTRTLVDTSVRKCWQIDSTQVHLGGPNWKTTLAKMVVRVAEGIGCSQERLSARLYKLLVYEEGGFFVEHRDSEKAVGMVGTLVVSLPAAGEGGELVVRHDGRETVVDLCVRYADELAYAAFYSDCRHETRPLTMGHRVSLVFNLILSGDRPPGAGLAPDYGGQVDAIEALLAGWSRRADGTDKLVWLLDHGYSQAGLSFDALKGVDAAVADVLAQAAGRSDCCLHSAILHIREMGTPEYEYYGYDDDGPAADDEISEVDESECWLDSWKSEDGSSPEFGQVPLLDGELLPVDVLADAYPDEAELHEAMGNGGAMVEHAYLNAALVLWPRAKTVRVLARAGIGGAVEYALAQIEGTSPGHPTLQQLGLVHEILEAWPRTNVGYGRGPGRARAKMLGLLKSLGPGAQPHAERFLAECVLPRYSTQEDDALIDFAATIGPDVMGRFLPELIERHLKHYPRSLPDLVLRLRDRISSNADDTWSGALRKSARTVHGSLREALDSSAHRSSSWGTGVQPQDFDSASIAAILRLGWEFDLDAEAAASARLLAQRPTSVAPDRAIPTALAHLSTHAGKESFSILWRHATDFLLSRSATPPEAPRDWHVRAEIKCGCEACRPFKSFCSDRSSRSRTFAIRQDLRYHLSNKIKRHRLPMDSRTVRTGRPYKLVCTKNRTDFRARIAEYARDLEQMESLIRSAPIGSLAAYAEERVQRLRTACAHGG